MIEGDLFSATGQKDRITVRAFVSEAGRFWYLFVLVVPLCLAGAFLKIRYSVPQYYVSGTVLIKDRAEANSLATVALGPDMEMFKPSRTIDDEIIILKSKSLMEKVLTELSLNTTYHIEGRVHSMEVYEHDLPIKLVIRALYPEAYGRRIVICPGSNNSFQLGEFGADGRVVMTSYKFGQQIEKSYGVFTVIEVAEASSQKMRDKLIIAFHDVKDLAARYSNNLYVAPVNKSANVLTLGLTDPVWKKSIDILRKLIEVYEKEAVQGKNALASSTLQFIDERLEYLTAELSVVEKNVEKYKIQNDLTDVSSEAQLYLKSADDYNKQLAEFEIQIDLLESIEEYLANNSDRGGRLVPSSLNIQDPTLLVLISKFNELQLERQRMLRTTQPDNPLILNLDEQLGNLRENIVENVRNIKSGLVITRDNLISNSEKFAYRIKRVPAMERQLLEINRQQGVKEGLYLYLLQKREEAALSLAASVSNFRIVDDPRVMYPIRVNQYLMYALALVLGIGLPGAWIYLRLAMNDKIRDVKDIESATITPVLGSVIRHRGKESLAVTRDAASPVVEMFRLIRSNLQFATLGKPNQVILITSAMSGEGKSFFSLNLAASLVLTGKRVVVLGMDLRKPLLVRGVTMADGPGITNYLISDSVAIGDVVKASPLLPELFVANPGPIMPCPTELMMSPKVGVLIETLRSSFDHIIIDSAPIGIVADAFSLAPYLDSTIYVTRSGYTPRESLSIIDRICREKKLKYPMIVLNCTRAEGKKYGYGYGYYYKNPKGKTSRSRKAVPKNDVPVSAK